MYPKRFLAENRLPEQKRTAFILMPFAAEFDPIYAAIRRTLEVDEVGVSCHRADEVYKPEPIIESILRGIVTAEIIITDVTGRNPNGFYELGISHTVKDNCIILTRSMDDVPFDLRHLRCIVYENTLKGAEELRLALTNAVRASLGDGTTPAEPPGTSLFGKVTSTELRYEKWVTGYQSDRPRTRQEAEATRKKLFEKATAAIAGVVGLDATKVEGQNRVSFRDGFALSELRDESLGGQRGARFASSLLVAVNNNERFSANDIADRLGEQPHRISFVFDRPLDIQALFRFAKDHGLGLEGLSNDSLEIALDSTTGRNNYTERDWRLLASNRSGTGSLELFMAKTHSRGSPWAITAKVSKITPDRIMAVLEGSLPLGELIGSEAE